MDNMQRQLGTRWGKNGGWDEWFTRNSSARISEAGSGRLSRGDGRTSLLSAVSVGLFNPDTSHAASACEQSARRKLRQERHVCSQVAPEEPSSVRSGMLARIMAQARYAAPNGARKQPR